MLNVNLKGFNQNILMSVTLNIVKYRHQFYFCEAISKNIQLYSHVKNKLYKGN